MEKSFVIPRAPLAAGTQNRLSMPPLTKGHCPACRAAELNIYLDTPEVEDIHRNAIGSSRQVFSPGVVLRCVRCSHGFREDVPTTSELAELYRRMDVGVYEGEHDSRVYTAKRHVAMLNQQAAKGKLLDVGCASGIFLREALRSGWNIAGVEPNEQLYAKAIEYLGRDRIRNATLQEASLPCESFDAITLWDVLEHVVDPPEFLQTCAGLTKPGGIIIVKVPDLDSWQARIMGRRWPILLPEHLGYFTRASMLAAANLAGLEALAFTRGAVTFTAGYVLFRLSQHGVPGTRLGRRLLGNSSLGKLHLSLRLGEFYVTLRRVR
jgi:SAM-dependent methyltransferase